MTFGRFERLCVALAVGGAIFGIAAAVQASIPDSNGVIHACYNTSLAHGNPTGALRVIDTAKANGACASWETPLSWRVSGTTGPTGARGPTGSRGPTGVTGPEGPGTLLVGNSGGQNLLANSFIGVGFQSTTIADAEQVVTVTGTVAEFSVHVATAPGAPFGLRSFVLDRGDLSTAASCNIIGAATSCSASGGAIADGQTLFVNQSSIGAAASSASWSVTIR